MVRCEKPSLSTVLVRRTLSEANAGEAAVFEFSGDFGMYCPVTLRDENWLLPGRPDTFAQVKQRTYFFFDAEKKYRFATDTKAYLLPSAESFSSQSSVARLQAPPPR